MSKSGKVLTIHKFNVVPAGQLGSGFGEAGSGYEEASVGLMVGHSAHEPLNFAGSNRYAGGVSLALDHDQAAAPVFAKDIDPQVGGPTACLRTPVA